MRDVESIHCPQRTDFQSVNSVDHVIHRARGRGEVENVIHFSALELAIDVELQELKLTFAPQVLNVGKTSGEQVVHGDD